MKQPSQLAPVLQSDARDGSGARQVPFHDRSALFRTPSVGSLRATEKRIRADGRHDAPAKQGFPTKPKPQRLDVEEKDVEESPPSSPGPTRSEGGTAASLRRSAPPLRKGTLDMLYNQSLASMEDKEIVGVLLKKELKPHLLETYLGDPHRAVTVRRQLLGASLRSPRSQRMSRVVL